MVTDAAAAIIGPFHQGLAAQTESVRQHASMEFGHCLVTGSTGRITRTCRLVRHERIGITRGKFDDRVCCCRVAALSCSEEHSPASDRG